MAKFLALMFVLSVLVGLQILTMIHGWGVSPKSYWWIIGVGLFGQVFMKLLGDTVINSED